jgi:hypothetical protein
MQLRLVSAIWIRSRAVEAHNFRVRQHDDIHARTRQRRHRCHELVPFGIGFHVAFPEPGLLDAVDTEAGRGRTPDKRFQPVEAVDNHSAPVVFFGQQFADDVQQIVEGFNRAWRGHFNVRGRALTFGC